MLDKEEASIVMPGCCFLAVGMYFPINMHHLMPPVVAVAVCSSFPLHHSHCSDMERSLICEIWSLLAWQLVFGSTTPQGLLAAQMRRMLCMPLSSRRRMVAFEHEVPSVVGPHSSRCRLPMPCVLPISCLAILIRGSCLVASLGLVRIYSVLHDATFHR